MIQETSSFFPKKSLVTLTASFLQPQNHVCPQTSPPPRVLSPSLYPCPSASQDLPGFAGAVGIPTPPGSPWDSCSLLSADSTGSPGPFPSLLAFKGFQSLSFSKPNYSSTIPPTGLGARFAASPLPHAQRRKVTARGQRRRDRYGAFSPCTTLQTSGSFWKGLCSISSMSRELALGGLGHLEVLCVLWISSSVGEVGRAQ